MNTGEIELVWNTGEIELVWDTGEIDLVWNTGEIILAGEKRSRVKTRRYVTFYSINPTWNGVASNPRLGA
jgi:hypothetical protein